MEDIEISFEKIFEEQRASWAKQQKLWTDFQEFIFTLQRRRCPISITSQLANHHMIPPGHPLGFFTHPEFNGSKVKEESIIIYVDLESQYSFSILFHELAHATGMPRRLDRPGISNFNLLYRTGIVTAPEEIIAESVALRMMELFKLADTHSKMRSQNYIDAHKRVFEPSDFYPNIATIEAQADEAFQYILDHWIPDAPRLQKELEDKMREFHKF